MSGRGQQAGMAQVRRAVRETQRVLATVYRLDLPVEAWRFVLPAEEARAWLPAESPRSGVLALQEAGELWLGLYLDPRDAGDPDAVAEETSHFVCLAWHAAQERPVSALLLELQSEIDRYVLARLSGRHALTHFEGFRLDTSWMDREVRRRYELANEAGHRYCRELQRRYPRRRDTPGLLAELRRFYRAPAERKLRTATAA